jgi:hypothetical protein
MSCPKSVLFITVFLVSIEAKPLSIIKRDSTSKDTLKDFTGIWLRSDFAERLTKYGSPRLANDYIPNIMSFQPCDKFIDSCVEVFTNAEGENIMGSEIFHRDNDSIIFSHLVGYCYKMYFGADSKELNCVLKSTPMGFEIKDTIIKYVKIGKTSCETQSSASKKLQIVTNKALFAGSWELLNLKTLEKQILILGEEGTIQNWEKFDSYYPFTDYHSSSESNRITDLLSFRKNGVNKEQWFGYKNNGTTINLWNALDNTQTIVYELKRQ